MTQTDKQREWSLNYYYKHREKRLAANKKYLATPEGKAKHALTNKLWHRKQRKLKTPYYNKTKKLIADWRKKNPLATPSEGKLNKTLKRTNLLKRQPCIFCKEIKTIAHHEDYLKPLNVIWMCRSCHQKYHLGLIKK